MPGLSVVVPTYNCAPFLGESLDSILAQVGEGAEVIVVDDGSQDDTPNVLFRYRGRITVVEGRHRGLAAARNLGLAHATGDWIAFHDADDVALPDRLEFSRAYLQAHPEIDALFCNGERLDRPGARMVPVDLAARCDGKILSPDDLFRGYPIYFQGALIPRRAFIAAGQFDCSIRVQPDIEYAYRLVRFLKARFVDRVLFKYRWHAGGNSRDRLGGREDIARILEGVLRENGPAARAIGLGRLRARIARHYYRIARTYRVRDDRARALHAARRAVLFAPLNLRYRLLAWSTAGAE